MPRIYLSPERRAAPHGKYSGYDLHEREYAADMAARISRILESRGFEVKTAEPKLTIYQRPAQAAEWGADYYMPIHTNASTNGENGAAQGALVLTAGDSESIRAAGLVFERLNALRPSARGVQQKLDFFEIKSAEPPVVYPEIAFHDNPQDARFLVENREAIALALAEGVAAYFETAPTQRLRAIAAELTEIAAALEAQ